MTHSLGNISMIQCPHFTHKNCSLLPPATLNVPPPLFCQLLGVDQPHLWRDVLHPRGRINPCWPHAPCPHQLLHRFLAGGQCWLHVPPSKMTFPGSQVSVCNVRIRPPAACVWTDNIVPDPSWLNKWPVCFYWRCCCGAEMHPHRSFWWDYTCLNSQQFSVPVTLRIQGICFCQHFFNDFIFLKHLVILDTSPPCLDYQQSLFK